MFFFVQSHTDTPLSSSLIKKKKKKRKDRSTMERPEASPKKSARQNINFVRLKNRKKRVRDFFSVNP